MRKGKAQKRILNEIEANRPRVLILSFDGTLWSASQNYSKQPVAILAKKKEGAEVLAFVEEICELQNSLGGLFILMQPANSSAWKHASLTRLRQQRGIHEEVSHMCMFGVKSRAKVSIKKPVRIVSDSNQLTNEVIRTRFGRS